MFEIPLSQRREQLIKGDNLVKLSLLSGVPLGAETREETRLVVFCEETAEVTARLHHCLDRLTTFHGENSE